MKRKLYFAYGSNLHVEQMKRRCPLAKPLRGFTLKDWRLVFRGVADIEPCVGEKVSGGLFVITPDCERALDRYEGFPSMYRKEHFLVRARKDGKRRIEPVLFYRMNYTGYGLPSPYYLDVIRTGYENFDLPLESLKDALYHVLSYFKESQEEEER